MKSELPDCVLGNASRARAASLSYGWEAKADASTQHCLHHPYCAIVHHEPIALVLQILPPPPQHTQWQYTKYSA